MRETVENLIDAIAQGNAIETESAFAAAMAEKLAPMLDARRMEVAQSMFAQGQEAVSEESKKDDEEDEDESEENKEDEDEDKEEMKEAAYTNPGLETLLAKKRAEKANAVKKTS